MGRAPSSGYCHNCRKRRVKCDKTKPGCFRCAKAGYTCLGYHLPLRMQRHLLIPDSQGGQQVVVLRNQNASDLATRAATPALATDVTAAPGLPQRIRHTDEELSFAYFLNNYAWAHFWRPIMRFMPTLASDVDVPYTASLALAVGVWAAVGKNETLKIRALKLYDKAISGFRRHLSQASGDKEKMALLPTSVILISLFTVRPPSFLGGLMEGECG